MAGIARGRYGGTIDPADANDPRTRIVNLVRESSRALEVGCGSGTIVAYLAREKNCKTLAVEPDQAMAGQARALGIEVFQSSIEEASVQERCSSCAPYDAIIFADVLEHLADPWGTLAAVRPWLAPGGAVLASIPNVAHWSIRLPLFFGRWEYTDGYLMDRAHLRWFTARTARTLFATAGYRIAKFQVRWAPLPADRLWRRVLPGRVRLYAALARLLPGLFGYQFVVRAEKE